jgi:autonomous glycyl radical cofactor GrcA
MQETIQNLPGYILEDNDGKVAVMQTGVTLTVICGDLHPNFNDGDTIPICEIENFTILQEFDVEHSTPQQSCCGFHINVNVMSREKLEEVFANPDKYPTFPIRVSGYCLDAHKLTPEQREDVLNRTFHESL